MGFSGFLRRVVVKSYEFVKEPSASIFRVTVTVEMDTEVIRRKQMCLLLSMIKKIFVQN
jgi:tRNA nucleotidyltransferase (CCA-adding enzyme)